MSLTNLSLFLTGIVAAAVGILGFSVFLNNRKGLTHRNFFIFSLLTIGYIGVNYLSNVLTNPDLGLTLFRLTIFLATWHAFWIFQLLYVFPSETTSFPRWYKYFLIPITAIVSILTLTPFVFQRIGSVSATGQVLTIVNGPGIALFGILVVSLITAGLIVLLRKTIHATGIEKSQFKYVLTGTSITFILLVLLNFIFPALLNNSSFVAYGPLFFFPFIIFTFYAITRRGLLNIKVISTEILAFFLSVISLVEVIISASFAEILLRTGVFLLTLIFSFFLIQSVQREIEQREELQRLNEKLDAANKQLEELSHFKSELLSLASHQIRSPLAAIKGFGTLIVGGSYGPVPDKIKEKVQQMSGSANELIGLINTLLDMRKVEEGKMDYQMARTDLAKLVTEVVDLLKPLAETKKLEFTLTTPGHEVFVNADAEKLKQVVQNLTDNSIKYTPSGFVHVELKEEDGSAIVSVSDSGVGIPATLVPHLFEEFIRDERVKKQVLGTGLGLYIARKIAEAHGGTIWAESEGEGKGSVFHMKVPEIK